MNRDLQKVMRVLQDGIRRLKSPQLYDIEKAINGVIESLIDEDTLVLGPDHHLGGRGLESRVRCIFREMGFIVEKGPEGSYDALIKPPGGWKPKYPLVVEIKSGKAPGPGRNDRSRLSNHSSDNPLYPNYNRPTERGKQEVELVRLTWLLVYWPSVGILVKNPTGLISGNLWRNSLVKTAYLDNDVICGIVKKDLGAEEDAAIGGLLELKSQGGIRLVTSEVTKVELAKWKGGKRPDAEAAYEGLEKVEYIEDHMLLGFNNQWGSQGGSSSPMIEDDPVARALWTLGLTRTDSHHLMLAIRRQCDFFVTCDQKTILNRRSAIEAEFPGIRLLLPSELLSEMGRG